MITNLWKRTRATFTQRNPAVRIITPLVLALALPGLLQAAGPAPVNLGSTANFVILSGAAITTTGGGIINGNIGASPIAGSAIGVSCAQVIGTIYEVDASGPPCAVVNSTLLSTAKNDLTTAYNDAAGRTPTPTGAFLNPNGGNLGGQNLAPGLYQITGTTFITGSPSGADLTLTGGPNDVWIFQCGQDLQVANGSHVILAGGAQAANVYWQVGSSATLGAFSDFSGTILAAQAITMGTSSTLTGRALASAAGVTFNGSGAAAPNAPTPAPTMAVQQPAGTNLVNNTSTNNFGSVTTGNNTSLTYIITNSGNANLTVLGVTIDGPDAALFSVTANPATLVGPGGSTTFTVNFAPATPGVKTAALHITSTDANNTPFNLALAGTGTSIPTAPVIAVQQPAGTNLVNNVSTNNFGSVTDGTNSSLTFIITNSGNANLTGLGITIDGPDAALFSVTTNPNAPVSPAGSTTFTVRFAPVTPGVKTAALHIASNDANHNPFNLALTGTGTSIPTAPIIAVQQPAGTNLVNNASTNNFGSVTDGTNTSLTFIITNSGNANLTGLGVTIDGPDAALFSVTTNPNSSVSPAGSTTFTVRFAPVTPGVKTAALHIASNDANHNPFNLALTGTGTSIPTAPIIAVQQPAGTNLVNNVSTNNFGTVNDGTNTSLTYIITNSGNASLASLAITINGPDAALFSVTANPAAVVSAGGSTTFTVSFAPLSPGAKSAVLHIASNDANNNPFNLALTGTGVILTNVFVIATSPLRMDPQTGLFTNSVVLTNSSANTVAAVRLHILNLPADVTVYYASGSTNGVPYVQYNFPLAPAATVNFTIEYYRANRQAFATPTYVAEYLTNAVTQTITNGTGIMVTNILLSGGQVLVGFYTTPGRTYAVQYSADMITWLTVNPFVVAPVNYVQWIDSGPPKTQSLPATRFYRVFKLP